VLLGVGPSQSIEYVFGDEGPKRCWHTQGEIGQVQGMPLNQRELRDSIIRRDTYKLDRKKMFTNTVSSDVPSGIGTNYQMNC
jgi:hypothetical protein